jgi:hypothetical protein
MRELSFIAPLHTNSGEDTAAALAITERELLASFGGFTREQGISGAWLDDNGREYEDASIRYVIASDWTEEALDRLRAIVAHFAFMAEQLSVYVKLASGDVEFINPTHVPPALSHAACTIH